MKKSYLSRRFCRLPGNLPLRKFSYVMFALSDLVTAGRACSKTCRGTSARAGCSQEE